jgi:exopolysaccharide production protein ExoQ
VDGLLQPAGPPARVGLRVDATSALAFVALAALILDPLFGSLAALLFLLAGGLLLATRPAHTIRSLLRFRYVLILPAFCLLSVLWSQFPVLSLRYGVQLALTFAIAIVMACRVAPITLMRCLFGIYGIGVVGSILFGRVRDDIGAWIGIFGSKNAFAAVVSGFALTAVAMLFDRSAPRLLRLSALAGLAVCGPLLIAAQSAGAMLALAPAAAISVAIIFSRRMSRPQKVLAGFGIASASLVVMLVVAGYGDLIFENVLRYFGKDDTLTGRTELWAYGTGVIEEHPWLGVGYQAFWVQGSGPAEMLWAAFGIASRMGFNFHNTYISNAVEIGFVGLAIQLVLLYGAWIALLLWSLRSPRPETAFLTSFVTLVICASFGEVAVFFQFSVTSVIVVCALVYALQARETRRARGYTLTPAEPAPG